MKKYLKLKNINNKKLKLKISTILFFMFINNSYANAEALKISPKSACNFLDEFGLKAQSNWKKTSDNQWGCSHNQTSNNITTANFSYSASGFAKEVNNIEIKAEVIDKKFLRLVQKKLVDISSTLGNEIIDSSIAGQIKQAIVNNENFTFQNESSIVNFIINQPSNNQPLTMTIKINSK